MKIRKIISCIIMASLPLWLTGCNSGSGGSVSTSAQSQAVNSQVVVDKKTAVSLDVETLDKWWNDKEAAKINNASAIEALGLTPLKSYFSEQVKDMVMSLLSIAGVSFDLQSFVNLIFPSGGKSEDELRFEQIMGMLQSMDKKLDTIVQNTITTLTTLSSELFNQRNNDFKDLLGKINSDRDLAYKAWLSNVYDSHNVSYQQLWEENKFDFNIKESGSNEQHINPEALKLVKYIAMSAGTPSSISATETRMQDDLQQLTGMYNDRAYGKQNLQDSSLMASGNVTYMDDLIRSIMTFVASGDTASIQAFSDHSNDTYRYRNNGFTVSKENNRARYFLVFNDYINQVTMSSLNALSKISQFEYMNLAIWVLGGNNNFRDGVPPQIRDRLGATGDYKEDRISPMAIVGKLDAEAQSLEQQGHESDAKKKYREANDERVKAFVLATNLLNNAYKNRAANLESNINSAKIKYANSNKGLQASLDGYAFLPTIDMIGGNINIIGYDRNYKKLSLDMYVESSTLQTYVRVQKNNVQYYERFNDVIANNSFWDGSTVKSIMLTSSGLKSGMWALNLDAPIEQKVGTMCLQKSNVYNLVAYPDGFRMQSLANSSHKAYLYCSDDTFNFQEKLMWDWNSEAIRQLAYFHFPVDSHLLQFSDKPFSTNYLTFTYVNKDAFKKDTQQYPQQITFIRGDGALEGMGVTIVKNNNTPIINTDTGVPLFNYYFAIDNSKLVKTRVGNQPSYLFFPVLNNEYLNFLALNPGSSDSYSGVTYFKDDFYLPSIGDYSHDKRDTFIRLNFLSNSNVEARHNLIFYKDRIGSAIINKYQPGLSVSDSYKPFYCGEFVSALCVR